MIRIVIYIGTKLQERETPNVLTYLSVDNGLKIHLSKSELNL